MTHARTCPAALVTFLLVAPAAPAGPYANDLAKCLVESTTKDDRVGLVRWMFSSAAVHPAVSSLVSVAPEQIEGTNRATGALVMTLLTESCREQTRKAFQFEGATTLQASFQVLGHVAGQELFANPAVAASMAKVGEYMDEAKLDALFAPPEE